MSRHPEGMPGVRVVARVGPERLFRFGIAIFFITAFVYTIVALRPDLARPTNIGVDASNYYAAGERLADGRALYALTAGDRPAPQDNPPLWHVALLSPPPIAGVWRVLAVLPGEVVIPLWWVGGLLGSALFLAAVAAYGSLRAVLIAAALCLPAAVTGWSGNVNAYLLPVLALSWYLVERETAGRRSHVLAGVLIGMAVAVKLTPATLLIWLLVRGKWAATAAALASLGALLLGGLAMAGARSYLDYLDISRATVSATASSPSLSTLAMSAGLPTAAAAFVVPVAALAICAVVVLLRRRPGAAFAVAVVGAVIASPVVRPETLAVGLAALAPWVRPSFTSIPFVARRPLGPQT